MSQVGWNALMVAVEKSSLEIVTFLLNETENLDVNMQNNVTLSMLIVSILFGFSFFYFDGEIIRWAQML